MPGAGGALLVDLDMDAVILLQFPVAGRHGATGAMRKERPMPVHTTDRQKEISLTGDVPDRYFPAP